MKKVLINGSKIQAKNDGFNDGLIFTNKFYKKLENLGYNMQNIKVKFSNGEILENDFDGVCETIASKNLPMVYKENDHIIVVNDYSQYELIR